MVFYVPSNEDSEVSKKGKILLVSFLIAAAIFALIFVFVVFNGSEGGGSSSDDSGFPFFIIYSSWPAIFVAIFVPIMAQKRQEAKRKEEERRNQVEG
jgi:uncharacterized membrane protein